MSNSEIRGRRELEELILQPDGRLRTWLRERERMGVLSEAHAAIDDALARGYALGLEEARAEALDTLRTLLCALLEDRFGELDEGSMEQIEGASQSLLGRWIKALPNSSTLAQLFAGVSRTPEPGEDVSGLRDVR